MSKTYRKLTKKQKDSIRKWRKLKTKKYEEAYNESSGNKEKRNN